MKKSFLMAISFIAVVFSLNAKSKINVPEIIDYQGLAMGNELPAWVKAVSEGNKKKIYRSMDISDDYTLFILSNKGNDLDFLKTWTDQVDVRAEIASSIEQTVGQVVQSEMAVTQLDEQEKERKAKIYSAAAANVTLNGLAKEGMYWLRTRTLKNGLKKAKSDSDYDYEFVYYVVFSLKTDYYNAQFESAIKNVEENSSESEKLRGIISEKVAETMVAPEKKELSYSNINVEEIDE